MEMEKKKRGTPKDRLSELPDSLIFSIFEFLPMKDVARTQILSHRWEKLWTLTPYLSFVNDSVNFDEFHNFVNRCLLRWRGTRVQKFKVEGCQFENSLYSDVDLWIRFAVDNGVEELDIYFQRVCSVEDNHFVPQCLYTCSSLRNLKLRGVNMDVRGKVEWKNLKSLRIEGYEVTSKAVNQIVCGSPLLEVFILCFVETQKNSKLCFRSSSLKQLHVCKAPGVNDDMYSELEIWTPNVEMLTFTGIPYAMYDLIGRTMSQIFPTIQQVERLSLSHWCIKVLGDKKSKGLLSPLSNVMFLTINGSFKDHEQIVDLLEIFPKLKKLEILEDSVTHSDAMSTSNVKFEPNPSKLFLEELTTVDVTSTKHDCSIFPLVKSLLKYAGKLEKMMVRVKGTPPLHTLFQVIQELLRMPRCSPNCSVNIMCNEWEWIL